MSLKDKLNFKMNELPISFFLIDLPTKFAPPPNETVRLKPIQNTSITLYGQCKA